MYPKILVPLDGSELAESALAEVEKLAGGGQVREIVLLSVVPIPQMSLGEGLDYQSFRKAHFDGFQEYLAAVRSRITAPGVAVTTEVQEGNPAQMIVNHAQRAGVDMIVIATHGYSGMRKLMFGSVALQVLHDADVPVLLIRPKLQKK